MRRSSRQILIQAALGVSLLAGANTARAANITWTAGGGANTNFSSTLNWATATIPGASDNSFIQLPGATTVTLDVNPHTFLAWLGAPSGGTLTLNEGGGAARTWTLDTQFNTVEGGTVILNGLDVITNQFDLSNNTVTRLNSGVDVTTGRITLGTAGIVGTSGQVDVNAGATLTVNGFADVGVDSFTGTLNVNGGIANLTSVQIAAGNPFAGTLTLGNLNVLNGGHVTQNGGALTLASSDGVGQRGTLSINGAGSSYTYASHAPITVGGATTSLGTISVAGGTFAITASDAPMTVRANGTVALGGGGTITTASDVNIVGGRFTRSGGTIVMSGGHAYNVSGGGGFSSAGLFGLLDGNTMNVTGGAVGVTNGGFDVGNVLGTTLAANTSTLSLSGGSSTLTSNGISTWGGGSTGFANVTIAAGAQATLNSLLVGSSGGGANVTINGGTVNLSGTSGLIIGSGTGATTPAALVNVTGATSAVNVNISTTTIQPRGTLRLTNGGHFNTSGTIINVNGGTFDGAGGAYAFTAPSYFLTVSNGGSFAGNDLTAITQTANIQVNSAGRAELDTLELNGGSVTVAGAGSSFRANGDATFDFNARASIVNGATASFGHALINLNGNVGDSSSITVGPGSSLQLGALDMSGIGSLLVQGTANITGVVNSAGAITVNNAGRLTAGTNLFNHGPLLIGTASVGVFGLVAGNGSLTVDDTGRAVLDALRVRFVDLHGDARITSRPNGGNAGVSHIRSLNFADLNSSLVLQQWNLADNALVVDYLPGTPSPLTDVRNFIIHGYNNGNWTGSGLASSTAAADPRKALGYVENAQLGLGSFMGQTVDATSILVRCTFAGDSNLDGKVDLTDFTFLASNFNGSGKLWLQGDYNYDGTVDLSDFTLLAGNFNRSSAGDGASVGSVVPEPSGVGLLTSFSTAALVRRRRTAEHKQQVFGCGLCRLS